MTGPTASSEGQVLPRPDSQQLSLSKGSISSSQAAPRVQPATSPDRLSDSLRPSCVRPTYAQRSCDIRRVPVTIPESPRSLHKELGPLTAAEGLPTGGQPRSLHSVSFPKRNPVSGATHSSWHAFLGTSLVHPTPASPVRRHTRGCANLAQPVQLPTLSMLPLSRWC